MPVEYFLRYQGKCYDVGTKLKFTFYGTTQEGTIELISHNHVYIRTTNGTILQLSKTLPLDNAIIEIIDPVYCEEPQQQHQVNSGVIPSINDVFVGWVWYLVIMVVGVIFKDRWAIWIFATIIFFTWKNGGIKK